MLQVKSGRYRIIDSYDADEKGAKAGEISFDYEGSVLSQLRESLLPPSLLEFKKLFSGIRSFDLAPRENLCHRTRESAESIGRGGKGLAAFVHELGPSGRERLAARLREAYPRLKSVGTKALRRDGSSSRSRKPTMAGR